MDFTKYLIPMDIAQEGGLLSKLKSSPSEKRHKKSTLEHVQMNVTHATMSGATGFVYGIVTGGTFKPGYAITSTGQPITIINVNSQSKSGSPMSTASLSIMMPAALASAIKPGIMIMQQNWVDKKESE